jgi:hypothetical protein
MERQTEVLPQRLALVSLDLIRHRVCVCARAFTVCSVRVNKPLRLLRLSLPVLLERNPRGKAVDRIVRSVSKLLLLSCVPFSLSHTL